MASYVSKRKGLEHLLGMVRGPCLFPSKGSLREDDV